MKSPLSSVKQPPKLGQNRSGQGKSGRTTCPKYLVRFPTVPKHWESAWRGFDLLRWVTPSRFSRAFQSGTSGHQITAGTIAARAFMAGWNFLHGAILLDAQPRISTVIPIWFCLFGFALTTIRNFVNNHPAAAIRQLNMLTLRSALWQRASRRGLKGYGPRVST